MENFLDIDIGKKRYDVEKRQGWRGEMKSMPFIQFPADWKIQIIPPFGDAVVRFVVKLPSGLKKSIYLDSRDSLGTLYEDDDNLYPYWEVSPVADKDFKRCDKSDIKTLLELIADESPLE